ncbi:MAG: nucleotidyltransferase domain-containing protein [Acidobacteria bacterium]|nr:nucleotidyltransferase domain-containing protein [Acidobacteriota bacterium]
MPQRGGYDLRMAADGSDPTLKAFLAGLAGVRSRIEKVILFGSRVRGDEKPYSDYDVLIVVDERERDILDAVHDAVMDALLATGRLVSPKVYRRRDFDRFSAIPTPFFKNVLKEGIPLG